MPTSVGPNTYGEENLVFGYDLGDVSNSYKGEPTTNLALNPTFNSTTSWFYTTNGGGGFSTANNTGKITAGTAGSYTYVYQTVSTTVASNESLTWSVEFKNNVVGDFAIRIVLFLNGIVKTQPVTYFSLDGTGGTVRKSVTTSHADGANSVRIDVLQGSYYSNISTDTDVEFFNAQLERNTHVTPFTAGTRSATQGLIDLTGNSTIDLTNVSFDSNAVPDWDGTSDYIKSTTPSDFRMGTSSFTLEAVAKQDVNTGHVLLEARGNNLIGYLWVVNHGTTGRMSFFYNDDSNQNIHYQTGDFNVSLTGVYYHLAVKVDRNENNIYFYINGEQAGNAVALQHTNSISPSSSDYYHVGWDRGGSPWNGQIAMFKHYNRALTASEIKANYNALKGRFNI